MSLLLLSAAGIMAAMYFMARQQRALDQATRAATKLGQYTLLEKLGAGGMGTVYKARHAMLSRPTAVKLLNSNMMTPQAIARFEREVQLTSGLTHPNTVMIFDYGQSPDNVFYYAMEYLDGINLNDLVNRFGPLPEARTMHIIRQCCGSLAEAHAAGLVHRDIKPANIVLTCRGGMHDFVKVVDFGLVRAIDHEKSANITSPNSLAGTPHYLSPESIKHPETVDARADVYALAAVAYFLLTGTPVFRGATPWEICLMHASQPPEPPSVRSGRSISTDFENLLMRCLAKDRSERPASASDFLNQLAGCSIPEQWTAGQAAEWWTSHSHLIVESPIAVTDPSH
jgi:serine/threonine protein kinase